MLDANRTACVGDMCGLPYSAQCVGEHTINPVSYIQNNSFSRQYRMVQKQATLRRKGVTYLTKGLEQ